MSSFHQLKQARNSRSGAWTPTTSSGRNTKTPATPSHDTREQTGRVVQEAANVHAKRSPKLQPVSDAQKQPSYSSLLHENPHLYVRPTPNKGQGLFCSKAVNPGKRMIPHRFVFSHNLYNR